MHKNESCSEDGNYYENQLAELMDLRQAVRLESNPNSSTYPSTFMDKNATNNVNHNNNNNKSYFEKVSYQTKIIR